MSVVLVPTPNSTTDVTTSTYVANVMAAGGVTLTDAQSAILGDLVTAASNEINRFCGRVFPLNTFSEIVALQGGRQDRGEAANVNLSYFPVVEVVSVLTNRSTALQIQNSNQTLNQMAWVTFVSQGDVNYYDLQYTGINLVRFASGVQHTDTLFFQNYPTVSSLAAAVNALSAGGWSANILSASGANNLGAFPSTSLIGVREPKNAFSPSANLDLFVQPASSYQIDPPTGIMSAAYGGGWGWGWGWGGGGQGTAWNNNPDGFGGWGAGASSGSQYCVTYKAGFTEVPLAVQQVCAEAVKGIYARLISDPSLKAETTGGYSWTAKDALDTLSDASRRTLWLYKDPSA